MKKLLALILVICLSLGMGVTAFADTPFEPGPIDLRVSASEQPDGSYKVSYTAGLIMLEELAKAATVYRQHEDMYDLRFVCTLDDELVVQLSDVNEGDYQFDCAQWEGRNIFVYEMAEVSNSGLKLYYKLDREVLEDWYYHDDITDITEALMQPMTMKAAGRVSAEQLRRLDPITTNATVELEGSGIQKYFDRYSVLGARGKTTWGLSDTHGGHYAPTGCPRNVYCPAGHFEDLDLKLWYHDGIHYCVEQGLMMGTGSTTFAPHMDITRGMVVTILYRMEGSPDVSGNQIYDDVALNMWYSDAVEWADANEVVYGYGGGKFGPNEPITREQMAAILYRYAQYEGKDVSAGENTNILSYHDALQVSEYAIAAMQWACGVGLIQGSNDNLMPRDNTSRAQAATLFQRYCVNFGR